MLKPPVTFRTHLGDPQTPNTNPNIQGLSNGGVGTQAPITNPNPRHTMMEGFTPHFLCPCREKVYCYAAAPFEMFLINKEKKLDLTLI